MFKKLLLKLKESAKSVLPIGAIVLALHLFLVPIPPGTLVLFIVGIILLTVGMSIFTIGADMAISPIGEIIGSKLTQSRKLWLLLTGCFVLGIVVTIAEPDLQVLSKQVPSVPNLVLMAAVSIGVGVFLVLALLRILFQIKLSYTFIVLYTIVFLTAAFTAPDYLAVAFDSGGVTTGPITVPFILALGIGVSAVRGGKNAEEDSFGLCAICSIGPVLAVLIIGMFYDPSTTGYGFEAVSGANSGQELAVIYGGAFIESLKEVSIVLLPVVVIFTLYQIIRLRLPKSQIIKIAIGVVYTLVGLALFLTGVNTGFMPVGLYLGEAIASLPYNWVLIPLSLIMGFFVVAAEPAVYVLNKQVEEITSGAISRKMMMTGMSIGVGLALALAMVRIMTGISIWFILVPGYVIALVLTLVVPEIFTAIAFDSGGIASGTMSAAFLLPFAIGVCTAFGGSAMTDAFGIIALISMLPLITIQAMGLIYNIKMRRKTNLRAADESEALAQPEDEPEQGIIEFEEIE